MKKSQPTTEGSAFLLSHFSPGDKIENCAAQFLAVCWIDRVGASLSLTLGYIPAYLVPKNSCEYFGNLACVFLYETGEGL